MLVIDSGLVTTPGARVKKERLRQHLSREQLAERAKVSAKTVQRIEADERDQYLFLVEEALGLPPSADSDAGSAGEIDEDEVLRRVSHRKFWLAAARRALEIADMPDPAQRPGRGEIADPPPAQPSERGSAERDEPGSQTGAGGW